MTDAVAVCVFGAGGRMGREILAAIAQSDSFVLTGASVRPGDAFEGDDASQLSGAIDKGVQITADPAEAVKGADVAIDFSSAAALEANLAACEKSGCPVVIGTTGLSDDQLDMIESAAQRLPVLYARNTSVGVFVLGSILASAVAALGEDFDLEIVETHHSGKVDIPSGTALQLAEVVAAKRSEDPEAWLEDNLVVGQPAAASPGEPGQLRISSVRTGTVPGEHEVIFSSDTEELRLVHRALNRSVFAQGALRAAGWLAGREVGRYSMADVLSVDD